MKLGVIAAISIATLVTACAPSETSYSFQAEVDGCKIYRVYLKGEHNKIYMAKCGNTTTTNFKAPGKTSSFEALIHTGG